MNKLKKFWQKLSLIRKIVLAGGLLIFFYFLFFTIDVVTNLPSMHDIENPKMDLSTQLISADGKLLGSYHHDENRIYADLKDISPNVINSLISTEDERFYSHSGIDPMSIIAIFKDILVHFDVRGGSTITQQLARNLYDQVGMDRSIKRKVKEAIVAIIIESRFTKEEILQAYLNTTCFYGNKYGIETGAQALFSKHASELEVQEAALLVGMLKSPTYYSPTAHPDRALLRRNTVINKLVEHGHLLQEDADSIKLIPITVKAAKVKDDIPVAQAYYFKDHVKTWLMEWAKKEGKNINLVGDGLKVYTTIDSRMQRYGEKAVREHLGSLQPKLSKELEKSPPWKYAPTIVSSKEKDSPRWKALKAEGMRDKEIEKIFSEKVNMRIWTYDGMRDTIMSPKDSVIHYIKFLESGFVAIDPKNGQVRAWVGGVDFHAFQYDHVSLGKRQVGSTFKPFVYGAAIQHHLIEPCQKALDIPVSFDMPDGSLWTPENSGIRNDEGAISYMKALAKSKNQVTASVMKITGPEKVCDFAKGAGIKSKLQCVPSLCLGTTDMSVLELVNGYCSFVNQGIYNDPVFVTRIEDRHGNVLYNAGSTKSREAMDPNTAYAVVSMLQRVVDDPEGTAHRLRGKYGFTNQIGGKTGTTQDNSDGWFVGITPNLVAGGWTGCADRRVHFRSTGDGQGANMALPIWAIFMRYVYSDREIGLSRESFRMPEGFPYALACPVYTDADTTGTTTLPEFDK